MSIEKVDLVAMFWKKAEEMYNDEYIAKMRCYPINYILKEIEKEIYGGDSRWSINRR